MASDDPHPCMSPGHHSTSCATASRARLGGSPRQHNRLMLAIWSLMHGTAMLIIRGELRRAPCAPRPSMLAPMPSKALSAWRLKRKQWRTPARNGRRI